MTYPDGTVVDYVRNTLGQVTQVGVTPAEGGGRQLLIQSATYAPFGPATAWTYGNGRLLQRPLDLDYRSTAVHDTSIGGLDLGYGYDEVGQLTDLGVAGSTIPAVKLVYDDLGRLTEFRDAPADSLIEGYAYDDTGNRVSATTRQEVALPCPGCGPGDPPPTEMQLVTTAYNYSAISHRLAAVGDQPRGYDAAGNLETIGSQIQPGGVSRTFTHGADGRLAQILGAGAAPLASYRHNARGERVRRTAASIDTYTIYDESGHWLGDYTAAGQAKQQAIWLDDMPVGVTAGPVQQVHYVQPDHLGTPRAVIDAIRNVAVWSWGLKSEAFGDSPPDEDADNDGVSLQFDMRFPGQRYDSATGLNYNYFRDYESATGRYVQSDPIGLAAGPSTYAYVDLSPLGYIDPLGLVKDTVTLRIESAILRGDIRNLTNLIESGVLSPAQSSLARAGLQRLTMTAEQVIAKELRGSVLREFPGQLRNKTIAEIFQGARADDKACQTARKLLTDGRFKK